MQFDTVAGDDKISSLIAVEAEQSLTHFSATRVATASIIVTNTGDRAGDEVPL